ERNSRHECGRRKQATFAEQRTELIQSAKEGDEVDNPQSSLKYEAREPVIAAEPCQHKIVRRYRCRGIGHRRSWRAPRPAKPCFSKNESSHFFAGPGPSASRSCAWREIPPQEMRP